MALPTDFPAAGDPASSALLIHRLLDRPLQWAPNQRIIYRDLGEWTYREFHGRLQRLAAGLTSLGIAPGDRVAVMDVDSHRYLECFFAVPMLGAVLQTVNVRLSPEQILYTLNHAEPRILLVHPSFLPLLRPLIPRLKSVPVIVLLADPGPSPADETETSPGDPSVGAPVRYEELLAGSRDQFDFPEFDESTVATLFYTTGTTGEPKGVFFSHRQLVLHTLAAGLGLTAFQDPLGLRADDVYLPLTPMFHVHAWGMPYLATLLGLKQVYPGRFEPQTLLTLIDRHRVSFSHCVPTILQLLLHHPEGRGLDWSRFKVLIGGSALPKGLAREAMDRGLQVMAGYGMSETCPIVTLAQLQPELAGAAPEERLDVLVRAGFPIPLVRAGIVDAEDRPLPRDAEQSGELVLRAPWLTQGYFRDANRSRELWRGGWLHTGDLAIRDDRGYVRVTDRLKDVIKIGGEWISSLELENALSQHPAVKEVAVIGVRDARWDEHPLAEVVLREEHRGRVTPRELREFLHDFVDRGSLHKRAILTEILLVEAIPKTSVGKIDKRAMRAALEPRD